MASVAPLGGVLLQRVPFFTEDDAIQCGLWSGPAAPSVI
jgi:hypothetical protein